MKEEEIRKTIDGLHNTIRRDLDRDAMMLITPMVLQSHAMILDLTSQLSDISSKRLERQTSTLIRLTWAIVALTVMLLVFTVVLYKDSHELIQREKTAQKGDTK